jgi:hypothetical protein
MLTSWAFRMWTRFWINPGVSDTQAGNKVIAGALLPLLLPELAENTFAIDIDILSAFTRLGIIPATAPITFIHDEDSSVTIGRGLQAFVGVVRVKNRHMKALQGSVPAGVLDGQDPASADTIRTGNSQQKEADVNI